MRSLILALVISAACTSGLPHDDATNWTVLVDASGTIDSVAASTFQTAWRRVIDQLRPGDRVVAYRIATGIAGRAMPFVDVAIPRPSFFGSSARQRRLAARLRQRLLDVQLLEKDKQSRTSPILESLATASRPFPIMPGRKRVVIMSDMLEESAGLNFRTTPPSDQDAGEQFERWGLDMRPAWQGVEVNVVLAGRAIRSELVRPVTRFWRSYFTMVGARVLSFDAQLPRTQE